MSCMCGGRAGFRLSQAQDRDQASASVGTGPGDPRCSSRSSRHQLGRLWCPKYMESGDRGPSAGAAGSEVSGTSGPPESPQTAVLGPHHGARPSRLMAARFVPRFDLGAMWCRLGADSAGDFSLLGGSCGLFGIGFSCVCVAWGPCVPSGANKWPIRSLYFGPAAIRAQK